MLIFEEIYVSYYKSVYNYIYKRVKDEALAEDLAQEALIKVYGGLKDVDESRRLSSWIFAIARNTVVDYYRKRKINLEFMDGTEYICIESDCPEEVLINKEKQQEVKEALCLISQRYRRVLLLKAYWDLSYREIACRLKLNESTVKNLMHRGRRQFQKKYSEVCQA